MSEERIEDPQFDDAQAVDPPNNTEDGAQMSPLDSAPSPVDPPNNTEG